MSREVCKGCFAYMKLVGATQDDKVYWCSKCGTIKIGLQWKHPRHK